MPIEVTSAVKPGMEFSAMHPFHPKWCYDLSFGMEGSDMLILAARRDTKFDLVPSRIFENRLPTMYFHWYDHNTGEVESRPRDDPWASVSGLWRLQRVDTHLVSPASNTGSTISYILSPLELPLRIHILSKKSSVLSIELPRR